MIRDVEIKELETHADERGYFRELIRSTDPFFQPGFGQWSVSMMYSGVIKAWHIHQVQTDWWYVASGVMRTVLCDRRPDSPTHGKITEILMGDHQKPIILRIPPGVAHGCRCLAGPSTLFYVTSQVYNPQDEGRILHDDPSIGYDWLKGPAIT